MEEIVWLAGLLEGEGTFVISRQNSGRDWATGIYLSMADADVVDHAADVVGAVTSARPVVTIKPPQFAHWSPQYRWRVGASSEVDQLALAVFPYMGVRRASKIADLLEINQLRRELHPQANARRFRPKG